MAEEAKKAKKQHFSPLDLATLRSRIECSPEARRALASIVQAGCDETSLLKNLLPYFQHDTKKRELMRKVNRNFTTRAKKLGKRLKDDAEEITRFLEELGSGNQMITGTHIGVNVYGFWQLPDTMNSLAGLLSKLSIGLRSLEDPGDKMSSVIYICCLVRLATGKPHFKDIATIIASGTGAGGINIHALSDKIRNQINRDRKCTFKSESKSKRKSILERTSRYQLMHETATREVSEKR